MCSAEETARGATMPLNAMTRGALAKLDAMLRQKGLMAATLFRDRTYNTSYDAGDDLLDAVEFKGILDKAGVALSAADARAIVAGIDQDGNGELDIKELLDAIRAVRHPALQPQREAKLRAMLTREANRAKTATPAARVERVQPSTRWIGHVNEPDEPRPERRDPLREMRARRLAASRSQPHLSLIHI